MRDLFSLIIAATAFGGAVYGLLRGIDAGNPAWLLLELPLIGIVVLDTGG